LENRSIFGDDEQKFVAYFLGHPVRFKVAFVEAQKSVILKLTFDDLEPQLLRHKIIAHFCAKIGVFHSPLAYMKTK